MPQRGAIALDLSHAFADHDETLIRLAAILVEPCRLLAAAVLEVRNRRKSARRRLFGLQSLSANANLTPGASCIGRRTGRTRAPRSDTLRVSRAVRSQAR